MTIIAQSAGVNNKDMIMGGGGGNIGGNNSSLEDSYNDISKLEITEEESA
jgi:hypothetical protein